MRHKLALFILLLLPVTAHADDGNAEAGATAFKSRCMACHTMDKNKIGPQLAGVYGRKAGTVEGFKYSDALAASGIVWDDKKLDEWLAAPQKMVPGQKMNISVPDAKTRADIIAHLKTQK